MENSNFQLALTEPNGNYAVPDIEITDDFETVFSILSVADISQRKDVISKSITLPGTKNNNRIFGNIYLFNRESDASLTEQLFFNFSPNVGVRAILYENNFPILVGTLKIMEIDKDENTGALTYKGFITGNMVTFFGNIKDKYLTDLPGFDDQITFNINTITNSWAYNDNNKYVFPSIDFGNGVAPNPAKFDLRNFRPGIYARYYIKAILLSQGYKYKSAFIDSDAFKRIYVPYNEAILGTTVFGSYLTATGISKSTQVKTKKENGKFVGVTFNNITDNTYISLSHNVAAKSQAEGQVDFNSTTDVFTIKKYASTGADIKVKFDVRGKSNIGTLRVQVIQVQPNNTLQIGSPLSEQTYDFADKTVTGIQGDITLKLPNQLYDAGFRFAVIFYISSNDQADVNLNSASVSFNSSDAGSGSTFGYNIGDTFKLSDALPKNQKAIDFLKSLLNAFNLYTIENPENPKEIIIEPYDVFYNQCVNPRPYALDWTKKIDQQKAFKMRINTSTPKSYDFKFKEDTDYYNQLYTNTYQDVYGNNSIPNANGINDPQKVELNFACTVVVKENGDDKALPAIYTGDINAKKSYKSQLRLLFNNGVSNCAAYDIAITSGSGSNITYNNVQTGLTTYNVSHHVLNIGGVNLFNLVFGLPKAVYYTATGDVFNIPNLYSFGYQNQLREINDVNLFFLDCNAAITEFDIQNLSLRTPIFLASSQGLAYFKIVNLTYYSSKEISKLSLQKNNPTIIFRVWLRKKNRAGQATTFY